MTSEGIDNVDYGVTIDVLRPYYLANFRDLAFLESATPMDYQAVIRDTYFQNIIDYRLRVIKNNQLNDIADTISDIYEVLALLDSELKN